MVPYWYRVKESKIKFKLDFPFGNGAKRCPCPLREVAKLAGLATAGGQHLPAFQQSMLLAEPQHRELALAYAQGLQRCLSMC